MKDARTSRKSGGTALLTSVIAIFLIAGLSATYLSVVNVRQLQSRSAHDGRVAGSLAESAAASYVNALNNGDAVAPAAAELWPDAAYPGAALDPTGSYYVLRHMGGGAMHCRVVPQAARLLVTGIGEYNGVLQTVSVTTTLDAPPPLPPPGDAGAINVFGFPGQNIDFNYSITTGSGVSGGASNPAMIIQDPATLGSPDIQQFLADIENGVIDPNKFDGGVTAGYDANGDGTTTQISVINNPNLAVNQDTMEDFRTSLIAYADAVAADTTLGSFTKTANGNLTFGTAANPEVTVVNGDVRILNGSFRGAGTLIVRGSLTIGENPLTRTNGSFDWNGDVIVLGRTGSPAAFNVDTPSTASCTGNIGGGGMYVVSNDQGASFNLQSGNFKMQNGTAAVTLSSPEVNATLNITGGTMNIQGVLVEMGGTQADLKTQAEASPSGGSLELNGSVFVGVRQDGGQVNVDLNDQMHINFNQNFYETALDHINTLMAAVDTPIPPPVYTIESYAENFNP